jgi:cytochrome c-type biogenesis protein CcmH/NrfF
LRAALSLTPGASQARGHKSIDDSMKKIHGVLKFSEPNASWALLFLWGSSIVIIVFATGVVAADMAGKAKQRSGQDHFGCLARLAEDTPVFLQ